MPALICTSVAIHSGPVMIRAMVAVPDKRVRLDLVAAAQLHGQQLAHDHPDRQDGHDDGLVLVQRRQADRRHVDDQRDSARREHDPPGRR